MAKPKPDQNAALSVVARPVSDLIPYARNARTHSESRYVKERTCRTCGKVETIRKDSAADRCKSCSAKESNRASLLTIQGRCEYSACRTCGKKIRKRLGYSYCSVSCRSAGTHKEMTCKKCGEKFLIYKSALSGKTNSAGNYCSRVCYEKWMCKEGRATGRGSQWNKTRKLVKAIFPHCWICGSSEGLQVHHIAPFRMCHSNNVENLALLCRRHHKLVECSTNEIINAGSSHEDITLIMGNILTDKLMVSKMMIRRIANATS